MRQMRAEEAQILPYPVQNALTGDIRQAAAKAGRGEFMSLWAGQGVGLARPMPARPNGGQKNQKGHLTDKAEK